MIEVERVSMGYQPGQEIVKDVSFQLSKASFHFLAGPSGVGKTTLLSLLALTHRPTKGKIRMFGREVTSLPRGALPKLRRKIGVVSQDYKLLPHLSVFDNVGLPLKVSGEAEKEIKAKVLEMLEWVGLKDHARERPETLSGGQKQRVAIARAVINRPEILLCDEPSGNLDTALAMRFMYLFEALNSMGTTIFMATHDDALTQHYRYPVLHMQGGRLVGNY